MQNIFLIGFMGTGKSTIAESLKNIYGLNVLEMDELIAKQERMSIPEIFAAKGEEYFRNLETQFLVEMKSQRNCVVSCGGGAVLREENVEEMKKNGYIVLLWAAPETILERVKDNDDRPILNGNKNVTFITELMEKRRGKYEAAADVIVHTDGKTILEISEEVMQKVKKMGE